MPEPPCYRVILGLTVSSPAGGLSNPEIGHRDQAVQ
jgi:hypothetical protein